MIYKDSVSLPTVLSLACRPRNQKEIRENSPVTVTTNGTRGKELHVKTNLAEATTKTYSFDRVFGPDADQELVFQDVVSPMLKEVRFVAHSSSQATCVTLKDCLPQGAHGL